MSQAAPWLQTKWIGAFHWWKLAHFEVQSYLIEVLEHLLLFLVFYVLLCVLIYVLSLRWRVINFENDVKDAGRVLIVIAHPDDECMFFGPTVLRLLERECAVYLMCLSTGKNYGMGTTRKRELYAACKELGISGERIIVQNHSQLPDAIDVKWPTEIVANLILHQVVTYEIDTLITFDKHGVSRHVNHCSLYYAVAHLSTSKQLPRNCSIYVLESISLIRKYWLLLDIPICFVLSRVRYMIGSRERRLLYRAMSQHKSQMVWFRRLYLFFSRYQMINTLQKMDLFDIELDLDVDD